MFNKKIYLFIMAALLVAFTFTGCYVVTDENNNIIYDYGLTGYWSANTAGGNNRLRIENKVGSTINEVKYYVGALEPNWSSISSRIVPDITPNIGINNIADFTIGNSANIDIGADSSTPIWLYVRCSNDYLVGCFLYDSTNTNNWYLTVYKKR